MKKLAVILAALVLVPMAASADDLSANLSGGACQGFASLVTSGGTISYGIMTDHANPTETTVSGYGHSIDLQATFDGGSAAGTVAADAGVIADLDAHAGDYTLEVSGTGGSCQGTLTDNGGATGGTPGVIEVANANISILESAGTVTVTVNRNGGSAGAVSVDYATSDGTAIAGTDYQETSGTLNWGNGVATSRTIDIPILDNGGSDGDRSFTLVLSNPSGGAELGLSAATITIVDDESLVCVPDESTLCLNKDGRFKAVVTWRTRQGNTGQGTVYPLPLEDSGLFFFFNDSNIEMLLKVLDGCNQPGLEGYWVLYAATTNVEFTLTVTDTQTGEVKVYKNKQGQNAAPVLDLPAFATCP